MPEFYMIFARKKIFFPIFMEQRAANALLLPIFYAHVRTECAECSGAEGSLHLAFTFTRRCYVITQILVGWLVRSLVTLVVIFQKLQIDFHGI